MKIIVLGNPTPKQSFKAYRNKEGQLRTYPNPKHEDYKNSIIGQIVNQLPPNFKMMEGPIKINHVEFSFPYLKTFNKKQMEIVNGGIFDIGKIGTPDYDNLLKAVNDAFNKLIWRDDSRVCWLLDLRKIYGQPRFFIDFEEMTDLVGKYPLIPKWKPEKENKSQWGQFSEVIAPGETQSNLFGGAS